MSLGTERPTHLCCCPHLPGFTRDSSNEAGQFPLARNIWSGNRQEGETCPPLLLPLSLPEPGSLHSPIEAEKGQLWSPPPLLGHLQTMVTAGREVGRKGTYCWALRGREWVLRIGRRVDFYLPQGLKNRCQSLLSQCGSKWVRLYHCTPSGFVPEFLTGIALGLCRHNSCDITAVEHSRAPVPPPFL